MVELRYFILVTILLASTGLAGQNVVNEPAEISWMISKYAEYNKAQEIMKAWTIQVAVSADRRRVESERGRFGRIFPEYPLEWVHDDPYYILKLRDIAFARKVDAMRLLHQIKRRSSVSAILIMEDVSREKLLRSAL